VIDNLRIVGHSAAGADTDGVLLYNDAANNTRTTATVSNLDVSGFGNAGVQIGAWSDSWSGWENTVVNNVEAHDNGDVGINVFGFWKPVAHSYSNHNLTVVNSRVTRNAGYAGKGDNSGSGIELGGVDTAHVQSSTASNNGGGNDFAESGPSGFLVYDANKVTVSGNEADHNHSGTIGGSGFSFGGGVSNSVLTGNVSVANDGSGFQVLQPAGYRAAAGNAVQGNVSNGDGTRSGDAGIMLASLDGSGVANTDVSRNLIATVPSATGTAAAVRIGWGVDTVAVHDNVLTTRGGVPLADVIAGQEGVTFTHNTWIPRDAFLISWKDTSYTSFTAWHNASGQS
jgi:hypothetical protein